MSRLAKQSPNQQYMWGFNAPHRCAHCKLRFVDEDELGHHHRRQHGLKLMAVENWNSAERCYGPASSTPSRAPQTTDFNCLLCDQRASSWVEVSAHITHAHSRRVCPSCGRLFANEAALKSHCRNMHDAARARNALSCGTDASSLSSPSSSLEACCASEPASVAESGNVDDLPTASPAQVDCSICQLSQNHPQDSNGAFSCAHCTWSSLSVSRLKQHHLEMHDKGEYAKLLLPETPAAEVEPAAHGIESCSRDSFADRDTESVSGPSSRAESPDLATGSHGDKISKAVVPSVAGGAHLRDKKGNDRTLGRGKLEIACPSCNFTCATLLALRLHHVSEHDGKPFHEPRSEGTKQKSSAAKARQVSHSKTTARSESRQSSNGSRANRANRSFTAHGYQHDGFVCSDKSSLESDDEDSSSTAAKSAPSEADVSWHPSELSGEETLQEEEEEESSSSGSVDNEMFRVSCEKCRERFVSKLSLAVHMSKLHRMSFFCTYCFRGAKRSDLLQLHHQREHRRLPFSYDTLDGLRLVTVNSVDSDESEENDVTENTSFARKPVRHPARHRHRAVQKRPPRNSSQQSSAQNSSSEQLDSMQWRRKRQRLLSSTSEETTDCYEPEIIDTISRSVYYGYRCPKSVRAFHQLVANISHEFKCSAFTCGFSTDSASDFENHLKNHDLADVFCLYCGASVASPGALLTHLEEDHSDLRFQCCKCLYRTARNMHFSVHFPQAHPQDSVTSISLSSRGDPAASTSSVQIKEFDPYVCGFPGCMFRNRKRCEFEKHFEEAHVDADSFPCGRCTKSCQSVTALVEHFQDHGFADIECGYCSFGTASTGAMMLHACYCHSSQMTMFRVRSDNLGKELITSSDRGVKYETSYDLSHLTFQQRCCFCPALVSGFEDFQRHTSSKHSLSLSVQELADKLFMSYDYIEAVKHGHCPFCSFSIDDVGRLQQHVLKQELRVTAYVCSSCLGGFDDQLSWQKHIDNERCSATATLLVCDTRPLLSWVLQNLPFKFQRFTCRHCAQVFRVVSTFRSHFLRHYTYYPTICKMCSQSFRGIRAKECHMKAVHGGSGPAEGMDANIEAEIARQAIVCALHTCQRCGFQTFSQSYIEAHREKCSLSESSVPALQASSDRSEKGSLTTEEDEDVPAYYCMHCSVSFMYLERLLSHGFTQHGCAYFCSRCYRGFDTKEHFVRHCRGRACRRPSSVFHVDVVKRSSKRKFFFREITIDYDIGNGSYSSSGEELDDEMDESYYSFYNQDYEPVQGIDRTYVMDETTGMRLPVSDLARVVNIEAYVCIRDWKKTIF
ncbi:uncharacterized protein [Dermacentor andersoni]|uniref:uncharacterized protein n=1 Tax=Dermacentor andersoni TaxID=34620 RepID=UPI003B3BAFFC